MTFSGFCSAARRDRNAGACSLNRQQRFAHIPAILPAGLFIPPRELASAFKRAPTKEESNPNSMTPGSPVQTARELKLGRLVIFCYRLLSPGNRRRVYLKTLTTNGFHRFRFWRQDVPPRPKL